jgi:acetolactate synthase-1/2/3 large subunit
VTAGPGVTDALTAVANAYQARSPLVLIGGAAPLKTKGMGALQEIPQVELFKAITKASISVEDTAEIPGQLARIFQFALDGRPGPVFVELPFDILFNVVDSATEPSIATGSITAPDPQDIKAILSHLRSTEKPLLIAGSQVYWDGAHEALRKLAVQTGIPVYTNGAGRGTLPTVQRPPSKPKSSWADHCFRWARSAALKEAEVVLVLGTPLDFRLKYGQKGWRPDGVLIQVENDPQELNKNRTAEVALLANTRLVLEELNDGLQGIRYDKWRRRVQDLEAAEEAKIREWTALESVPINHFRFAAAVNRIVDEDTIVIADGGDIVSACAKVVDLTRPGQWLDPGPLGCLGVGLPFAIAAQHLFPEKKILVISGDGAFGLNGFEYDTAVRFNLPIVTIIGNDAGWGQIRRPQQAMVGPDRAAATSLAPTRYDRVVQAMGGRGLHVDQPADLEPALQKAFASHQPTCINVAIDPEGLSKTGASTPYIV